MSEIINKDGVDIEVFTQDEIEQHKIDAIEAFKAENPDKTEELTSLQTELETANAELEKLKSVDKSVSHFKKEATEAQKKVEEITKSIDEKILNVKREVLEGVMSDHKNDTLKALAGGDAELEKKIEYHYKRLGDVASTKAEITNKLKDAYVLAAKQEAPDAVNMNVFSSGGVGRLNIKSNNPQFSAEEKELGAKFGLKEEDFKKK